ncbi:MAG: SLBB domain-containing protein [Phycisphaeraceae bacterium]|nr:SLBB domain-containing protein [Phycisphaeraceae bacterium]
MAQMDAFQTIGPASPSVDMDRLVKAKIASGPYRVLPGEVLQLTMPAILQIVTSKPGDPGNEVQPYLARVSDAGTITLPAVGDILVAGHSLGEIEASVSEAYYPAYAKKKPSVYVEVVKPRLYRVSILGGVTAPGIYELRADEMSLVTLLMKAGGIVAQGAAMIRIDRSNSVTGFRRAMAPASGYHGSQSTLSNPDASRGDHASFAQYSLGQSQALDAYSDVRLSFRPEGQSGSTGRLLISRQGNLLVDEKIDLGSEAQRYSILARAVEADSTVSMVNLENKLGSLLYTLNSQPGPAQGSIRLASTEGLVTDKIAKELNTRNIPLRDGTILSNNVPDGDTLEDPLPESQEGNRTKTLLLPVTGLNVPFADVALYEGDAIVVDKYVSPRFTVLGLVNNEGLFEYPPGTNYSLIEAIALAGGLDKAAEPRWAVVYRLKGDGSIASQTVKVLDMNKDKASLSAMKLLVKPGDIIALEHTPRTRSTQFLKSVFRVSFGMYVPLIN